METRNKYAGRVWCMAVVGVTAVALHAYGQARAVNPNGRTNRKDKIETKAPSPRAMLAAGVTRSARAAVEYIDEDAPVIKVYSEQSKRSGRVASGSTQTYVYRYNQIQPYGIFYNYNSSTSDLTTVPGVFMADNLTFGNGFVGGMTISGYELYVYRNSLDPQPGLADVHVELWDGDPFEAYDIGADGYAVAPIPGTQADFVDIPADTHARLVASFDPEVVIPNRHVWMVLTSNACYLGWHLSWTKPLIGSDTPGNVVKLDIGPDTPRHVLYSDQTLESGRTAAGAAQTVVYENWNDSGYGVVMNYNVSGGGPVPGAYSADNLGLGNGFVGGDEISEIWITVFRSSGDLSVGQEATVHLELWDGDPEGFVDTAANGFSGTKIAGSDADWSIGTLSGQFELRHVYATPVVIPNQRMWAVTQSTSCRMFYNITYRKPKVGDDAPGDFWIDRTDSDGQSNGSGVCCHDGSACLEPDYGCGQANADACSDGDAEAPGWWNLGGPCIGDDLADSCSNFMHMVFSETDVVMSLVPVSADAPLEQNPTPDGWSISGDEITMTEGNRPVWLEIRISDWDPGQTGRKLKAWEAWIDHMSYTTGLDGALELYTVACVTDEDCEQALGRGSKCTDPLWPLDYTCPSGFIDDTRTDYVFYDLQELSGVNICSDDNVCYGATINDGEPIPSPGYETYAGTLVIWVPPDARGTFTIELMPWPYSDLMDQNNQLMTLLAVIPAKITVEIGKCCFGLGTGDRDGCIDGITVGQCADAGLCHGECSDTHDPCLSDDDCPAGETCSGACNDDGSTCWSDDDCTAGACSHDASACHADAECGETCADSGDACLSWWDCYPGVCSSWDYYCVSDADCPESGAVCGSAKGSCGRTSGSDWVECTDDSECTAYDPPICDKPWDPEPCGTLTPTEVRSCVGGATCSDGPSGDTCVLGTSLGCPPTETCVVHGTSFFYPGEDCSEPCIQCTDPGPNDPLCADGDACTVDVCTEYLTCNHTPVTITPNECCNSTPGSTADDLAGDGRIVSNVDDDQCTDNLCTPGSGCAVAPQCGVPHNPPSAYGTECDDWNHCTYNDICDGENPSGCAGLDVNAVECTTSAICKSKTGVAFDCVDGYCHCVSETLYQKCRYISLLPQNLGADSAIRVTFMDLPDPYNVWNGVQMWVGPQTEYCENSGQSTPPPEGCGPSPGLAPTFLASSLQCKPYFADWNTTRALHLYHEGIVPAAVYEVQAIEFGLDTSVEENYTAPLELTTSIWGDLLSNCTTIPCGPPDGSIGMTTDVVSMVDKYQNSLCAILQSRADLIAIDGGPVPDQRTTMLDIVSTLDAFRGAAYPFSPGPLPCP